MKTTEQTKGLTVLGHGEMVSDYFDDLYTTLAGGETKYQWRLPEWVTKHKADIFALMVQWDEWFHTYLLYHDIGKPYCRTVDEEGKQHFPDHASVSADIWLKLHGDTRESHFIADLMRKDMDMHLLKPSGAMEYKQNNPETCLISLIAALCELHANASMFGSIESTSFKIKWKSMDKIGQRILD